MKNFLQVFLFVISLSARMLVALNLISISINDARQQNLSRFKYPAALIFNLNFSNINY